jgi:hypothetical protein
MLPPLRVLFVALLLAPIAALATETSELRLDVATWRVVERESGPVNYYKVVGDPARPYIRAEYRPPYKTAVLGVRIPDEDRARAKRLRWSWRAITLPKGGNECAEGKTDSAAVVYVSWRRMLRWYAIKYVWSAVGPKGSTCDRRRNPFVAQDTVIVESGGPVGTWKDVDLDLRTEFQNHFEGGDKSADVPDLLGVGIMTDGDDTKSESAADYASFVLVR